MMSNRLVVFGDIIPRLKSVLEEHARDLSSIETLWFVRDLWGKVRIVVDVMPAPGSKQYDALHKLSKKIQKMLGCHAYGPSAAIIAVGDMAKAEVQSGDARRLEVPGLTAFLIERQMTGEDWSKVAKDCTAKAHPQRVVFHSMRGGVGRTTAASVLAMHLAKKGKKVLMLDLDLTAPGLDSVLLFPEEHPEFGIVDWFVEDAVDQGEKILPLMTKAITMCENMDGRIIVAPAQGKDAGEYLAKLGRVHLSCHSNGQKRLETWADRLRFLLSALETAHHPDVVILDSSSGLTDMAAALVTSVDALALLFNVQQGSGTQRYKLIFPHWNDYGVGGQLCKRIKMVAAMVPKMDTLLLCQRQRQDAWDLFKDHFYAPKGMDGPHNPLPIFSVDTLEYPVFLRDVNYTVIQEAYGQFLDGVDLLLNTTQENRR